MNRYRNILRLQAFVLAVVLVVLLVVGVVRGTTQLVRNRSHEDLSAHINHQEHFWRVVAGVESSAEPTVGNKFARDIRQLDSQTVESFRGNSNAYGGVTDEIGFDPFNEAGLNCFECGPLNATTKGSLELIHSGHSDVLFNALDHDRAQAQPQGYRFTPFGWSFFTLFVLLIASNIVFFLAYRWWDQRQREATSHSIREAFPAPMAVIDRIDKVLPRLPAKDVREVRELRDRIYSELESQTLVGETDSTSETDDLVASLKQVEEFLTVRQQARTELLRGER